MQAFSPVPKPQANGPATPLWLHSIGHLRSPLLWHRENISFAMSSLRCIRGIIRNVCTTYSPTSNSSSHLTYNPSYGFNTDGLFLVYPECAQLKVTGSGTSSPPSSLLVSFPGAYSGTEPGVAFNIDRPEAKIETTYPIPGPAVWDGTGNAPPATGEPSTPEPVPEPTTLVTAVIPAPTAPSCEPVARYGQCGGKTYSGCTVCAEGSKCVANGEYYSQCM